MKHLFHIVQTFINSCNTTSISRKQKVYVKRKVGEVRHKVLISLRINSIVVSAGWFEVPSLEIKGF